MIQVLICDDQEMVREGLRAILGTAPGIKVVGVAEDGAQAVELVRAQQPAVVLMDLNMPGVNGIQATRIIHDTFPAVRVLALTTYDADEWVFDAIRAGAVGYLLKDTPRADLLKAIEGTAAGQTFVDPSVAGKLFTHVATRTVATNTAIAGAAPGGKGFVEYRDRGAVVFVGRHRAQLCQRAVCEIGSCGSHPGGGDSAAAWAGRLKSLVKTAMGNTMVKQ